MAAEPGCEDAGQEVQRIWVYCGDEEEGARIASLCRQGKKGLRLSPQFVKPSPQAESARWRQTLQLQVQSLPPPYGQGEREAFFADACALLSASSASCGRSAGCGGGRGCRSLQDLRWPALLVTDRERLCRASGSEAFRGVLAEAASLRVSQLLPVVLSADFGTLCGLVVKERPLGVAESRALPRAPSAATPRRAPPAQARLPVGLLMRSPGRLGGALGEDRGASADAAAADRFGARCLAIFANGVCAYCGVSPDGARSVEASGLWEVINGQVVVGGSTGSASVVHARLSRQRPAEPLTGASYGEPVHFAVGELEAEIGPAGSFSACAPSTRDRLDKALRDAQPSRASSGPSSARPSTGGDAAGGGLARTLRPQPGEPAPAPRAAPGAEEDGVVGMHTALHGLLAVLDEPSSRPWTSAGAAPERGDSTPGSAAEPHPRLFGEERAVSEDYTNTVSMKFAQRLDEDGGSPGRGRRPSFSSALSALYMYATSTAPSDGAAPGPACPACPLRPGRYRLAAGSAEGGPDLRLEMTLRADGRCRYLEQCPGSTLRSVTSAVSWEVDLEERRPGAGGTLLLASPGGAPAGGDVAEEGCGFVLQQLRGGRRVERRVARVEVPLEAVLAHCEYTAPTERLDPFPRHEPPDAARLIFGLVDPASPVLQGLRCRPDRVPFHAFEAELRDCGLQVDEILSDFRFIDRDQDGMLSAADMRSLRGYGSPAAAPELLYELGEALLQHFDGLPAAFAALSGGAPGGRVTFEHFERFLQDTSAAAGANVQRPHRAKICDWMGRTTAEDRWCVFASINPSNRDAIDLTDFSSLSLHAAVLAVRRLEHFQGWVFEQFGRTSDVFAHVFNALNTERAEALSRAAFAEGARALGYPCRVEATRSIFSLLDRSFKGAVTPRDFQRLRDFSAERLLTGLEALKRCVDQKFGSADKCFEKLLERERLLQGSSPSGGAGVQTVSYAAFQKVCTQAGFLEQRPDADLKGLFLFLAAAFLGDSAGRLGGGFLGRAAWSALGGFSSRAVTGSPARLRRVLEERYGDLDRAFQQMHTAWLRRALSEGLRRVALEGMARALRRWEECPPDAAGPGGEARRRRADRWASERPPRAGGQPRGAAAAAADARSGGGALPPLAAGRGRSVGDRRRLLPELS